MIAVAAVVATLAALVTAHLTPTGLSPLRDPVSAYGISRAHALYRAQTLATAVAAAALAFALITGRIPAATPAVIALLALAVTRAVISWVPMGADEQARTARGRMHNVLAFAAFAAASVGAFMTGIAFSADGQAEVASASTLLGWFLVGASGLTLLSARMRALRSIFGLAERLIYVGMLAWLGLTAVALVT